MSLAVSYLWCAKSFWWNSLYAYVSEGICMYTQNKKACLVSALIIWLESHVVGLLSWSLCVKYIWSGDLPVIQWHSSTNTTQICLYWDIPSDHKTRHILLYSSSSLFFPWSKQTAVTQTLNKSRLNTKAFLGQTGGATILKNPSCSPTVLAILL